MKNQRQRVSEAINKVCEKDLLPTYPNIAAELGITRQATGRLCKVYGLEERRQKIFDEAANKKLEPIIKEINNYLPNRYSAMQLYRKMNYVNTYHSFYMFLRRNKLLKFLVKDNSGVNLNGKFNGVETEKYTIKELAEMLDIGYSTVCFYLRNKKLPYIEIKKGRKHAK